MGAVSELVPYLILLFILNDKLNNSNRGFDPYYHFTNNLVINKMLYVSASVEGSAKWYATCRTLSKILNGTINLGLNFPFFPKRITPFIGETLKNTNSPTENLMSLLLRSA